MAERVYYNQSGVRITTTRAVFGGQVYAVNGMTSVRRARISPYRTGPVLLMVLGLPICCCGLMPFSLSLREGGTDVPSAAFGVFMVLIGFGMAALGVWLFWSQKPSYAVVIRTASGEVKALVTRNSETVERIVAALSQAFADRG